MAKKVAGSITLGTELETEKFEQQLAKLERKHKSEEIDLQLKLNDVETAKQELGAVNDQLREIEQKREKINAQVAKLQGEYDAINTKVNSGELISGTEYQRLESTGSKLAELKSKQAEINAQYETQNQLVNDYYTKLDKVEASYNKQKIKMEGTSGEIEKAKNKMAELKAQQEKASSLTSILKSGFNQTNNSIQQMNANLKSAASTEIKGITKKINGIGKSVQGVTKSILKWGLALFGIRSAYNFIRQSISTVSEYNEGLSNQIKFMKTVVATALEPLVKRIISLVYTLLSFINSIVKKMTGKDLFAAAKKNMQSTAKSAKDVKKQLAGFDEMNILQDNKQSDSGGGFDDSGFVAENQKFLDILEKLKDMIFSGDWAGIARTISEGIVSGLNWLADKIKSIDWKSIGKGISAFLTNIDFSGILVGLVTVFGEAVMGLQDMLLEIDWGKIFKNLSTGITKALKKANEYLLNIDWGGFAAAIENAFTNTDWAGIGSGIISILWDSFAGLTELFTDIDWSAVGETVSNAVRNWINTIIVKFQKTDWAQLGTDMVDALFDFIEHVDWIGLGADILEGIVVGIKSMIEFFLSVFVEIFKRILEFFGIHSPSTLFAEVGVNLIKGLIEGIKKLINAVVDVFKTIVTKIKNVFSTIKDWISKNVVTPIANLFSGLWEGIKKSADKAWTFIKKLFSKGGKIFTGVVEGVANTFKTMVNAIIEGVNTVIAVPFKLVNTMLNKIRNTKIPVINKKPFAGLWKEDPIPVPQIPKLAKGGIINQPGRGVMVGGSAYVGERGKEGVIPLTDAQQMALLGEAIGRYITINANITNNMNGRVISRELQRITAEQNFAYNR